MTEYIIRPPEKVGSSLDLQPIIVGEIVRCCDCKHRYACGSFMFCELRRPDEPVNANGFCAWGDKRKEGGE